MFSGSDLQVSLETAIGCDLSSRLRSNLTVQPLYSLGDSGCESVNPAVSGTYYSNATCTVSVQFERTSQQQFCAQATDKVMLGEAGGDVSGWTLSPGTTYNIGALSLNGLSQPYRRSEVYRTLSTAAGECRLLMRIYKKDLTDGAPQRVLIALHGGSWRSRGFGSFGIESSVAQYTDRGFVVFAPYYRLLGGSEGSAACNGATLSQITDDAQAALSWVETNAAAFGASGLPVVLGQSAGAHLALSLAVNQPQRIGASILLYPPTDFSDLLQQLQAGEYTNEEGIGLMNLVLGDAQQFDVADSPVPENSYPVIVEQQNRGYPPMQILHGLADELVPARQSVRLCNALAGRTLTDEVTVNDQLAVQTSCGLQSELSLFTEANHALDICLSNSALLASTCLSGSRESRQLIANKMQQVALWAAQQVSVANESTSAGSGAVGTGWMVLLFVFLLPGRRGFRPGVIRSCIC